MTECTHTRSFSSRRLFGILHGNYQWTVVDISCPSCPHWIVSSRPLLDLFRHVAVHCNHVRGSTSDVKQDFLIDQRTHTSSAKLPTASTGHPDGQVVPYQCSSSTSSWTLKLLDRKLSLLRQRIGRLHIQCSLGFFLVHTINLMMMMLLVWFG